jgi:hypothetical protein
MITKIVGRGYFFVLGFLVQPLGSVSQCTVFSETFDSSIGSFTPNSGSSGNWQYSAACSGSAMPGHTATGTAQFIGLGCTYGNLAMPVSGNMNSVAISLPTVTPIMLSFNYRIVNECTPGPGCSYDNLFFEISTNGGTTFNLHAGSDVGTLLNDGTWRSYSQNISIYAGQNIILRYRFNSSDGLANEFDGIYVDDVLITAPNIPPTAPVGPTSRCMGAGTSNYTSSAAGATSYAWTVTGTGNSISGTGSSATVTWGAGFSGTAQVCVSATGPCGTAGPVCTTVNVNAPPAAPTVPSGATSVCQGSGSGPYTTSSAGATTYGWTVTGTGNTVSGTGSTGTVMWAAGYNGTAQVCVTASSTCGTAGPVCNSVTVNPLPDPPSIPAGPGDRCQGSGTGLYTTTSANATGYNWTVSGSGNTVSGSGTTGTVNWASAYSGTAQVCVTATNACGSSPGGSICTPVVVGTASVAPTGASANPMLVCIGRPSALTVSGGSLGVGASWNWYSDSCGINPVGSGTMLIVNPPAQTTYFVRAEGACGTTVCQSITVDTYSLNLVTGFTMPTSGSSNGQAWVIASGGNPPYTYQWDDLANQITDTATGLPVGVYTVTVTDADSCSSSTSVNVIDNVGTEHPDLNLMFEVYPNPARDFIAIKISLSEMQSIQISLLDIRGAVIMQTKPAISTSVENQIQVSHLAPGIYMLNAVIGTELIRQKIVIAR